MKRLRFALAVVPLVLGFLTAIPASTVRASTAYDIVGLATETVQGTRPNSADIYITYAQEAVAQPYIWINEGGSDCDGGTCWHVENAATGGCLDWGGGPASPAGNGFTQDDCSGGISNLDEDFSSPGGSGFKGWYSKGATVFYNDGTLWGVCWTGGSDGFIETYSKPLDNCGNDGKWELNG